MSEQVSLHMSPAQAAHVAGVSRWTIMRAIKSHELLAKRDNRNQWRITPEALEGWRAHSVHTPETSHTKHTLEAMIELREKLAAATARANAAEADRDRWQAMAERLSEHSRRSWWPWKK